MTDNLIAELSQKLWEYFIPEIKSGNPVVFCFHQEIVDNICLDLFTKYRMDADGRKLIDYLCSSFYEIINENVQIKESAFRDLESGFSPVIILVAQQVLAVEDMVKNRSLSEDAYFPRLRARISSDLDVRSQNPFEYQSFKKVWIKFREEIFMAGGTKNTITFFGGEGLNKSRSYPISQALLSLDDLFRLRRSYIKISYRALSSKFVGELLKKEKYILSKRGQRLIRNPALRRLVVDQIISFFGKNSESLREEELYKIRKEKISTDILQVRAYLSFDDWLSDGYTLVVSEKNQGRLERNEATVQLRRLLSNKRYLVLAKEDNFQDYFSFPGPNTSSSQVEKVLVLFRKTDLKFVQDLIGVFTHDTTGRAIDIEPTDLNEEFVIYQLKCVDCGESFIVENGLFLKGSETKRDSLKWTGGICVNRRSNIYLPTAPPSGLALGDKKLASNLEILSNGKSQKLGEFLEEISCHIPYSFNVKIKSYGEVNLDLLEAREGIDFESYGYGLESSGKISPVPIEVDNDQVFLIGLHTKRFASANPLFSFSRLQIAYLLDSEKEHWVPLETLHLKRFISGIDSADINSVLKSVCKQEIINEKKVPKKLADYITSR